MNYLNQPADVRKVIVEAFEGGCSVLFAGAGTAVHAGLPSWAEYLEGLAASAQKYEPETAALMRKRAAADLMAEAAHYYKNCALIPNNEKLREAAEPFLQHRYDARKLIPLIRMPFTFIVTTNYDHGLHDAWAKWHKKAPWCAELGDPSLKAAVFWDMFYIARIHGRAEVPASIVLDTDDYRSLDKNIAYLDFLRHVLTQRSCLFVGFSFLDPAINEVLRYLELRAGTYPQRHVALLPFGAAGLAERMARFNIRAILYDPRNQHEVLWSGIQEASGQLAVPAAETPRRYPSADVVRRLIALCYARATMGHAGMALREIVVQGLALSLISAHGTARDEVARGFKTYLSLDENETVALLNRVLDALIERGLCAVRDDLVTLTELNLPARAKPALDRLVEGGLARIVVRETITIGKNIEEALAHVLEETIVMRGWDLGAQFAGARTSVEHDLFPTISASIRQHMPTTSHRTRDRITEACIDLFRRPDPEEEKILADFGRVAFGVEIVLQSGRSALYEYSLPENVYLDSNVLMPAMTAGHPYRPTYLTAIQRLEEANRKANVRSNLCVADVFLNEIVAHRSKAIHLVEELSLEDIDRLGRHIMFYGADYVNVFVGAYSSWVQDHPGGSFAAFLDETAPYSTDEQAAAYVTARGIKVVHVDFRHDRERARFADMHLKLQHGYHTDEKRLEEPDRKPEILVEHEAAQLALIESAASCGQRTYFVTADKKLVRITSGSEFAGVRDFLISEQGFIQLIDLLVGIHVDPGSLTRIFWAVRAIDEESVLRNYLVDLALKRYDAALVLRVGDVLDAIVHEAKRDAQLEGVQLLPTQSTDQGRTTRFLDRFEEKFFVSMAEEVQKLRKPHDTRGKNG